MNEKTYNRQVITAYLLGSLPEAEAERFDELSFTDDLFADDLKTTENDLIDAYVDDELTNPTLEKFESYYLASPVRREKVKFAQAFQVFAEKSSAVQIEKISENDKHKRVFAGFFSALNIFAAPRRVLQWSFAAAALLFMALGGWLFFENSRLRNQISQTQERRLELERREKELQGEISEQRSADLEKEQELARVRGEMAQLEKEKEQNRLNEQERKRLAEQNQKRIAERELANTRKPAPEPRRLNIASFILTPQLRGSNQLPTLSISPQTDSAAMQLELESDDYAVYRVALRNPSDNRILWQSGRLKAKSGGENKRLNISFSTNLLKSQVYSLEVSGISADGTAEIISNYSFRIVR